MPGSSVQARVCATNGCDALMPAAAERGRPRKYCLVCRPRTRALQATQLRLRLSESCDASGCDRPVLARGLCNSHYHKDWKRRNPGYMKAYQPRWRAANPGYDRRWRAENPERAKAIADRAYANNREANVARSVARKRGIRMASSQTMDYRTVLLGDPCSYCGGPATEIDHIEPVATSGSNEWPNLTAACRGCNPSKGKRPLLEFLCQRLNG